VQVVTNCSRLVAMLFQLSTGCVRTACSQLVDNFATRLLSSADLLQVVPAICYRPATICQQVVSDDLVATG
jgi:hypothetical protein